MVLLLLTLLLLPVQVCRPLSSRIQVLSTSQFLNCQLLRYQVLQSQLIQCQLNSDIVSTPPITPPILTPAPNSGQYRCVTNPLVAAGLVSPDLVDILAVPLEDAAVTKRKTKRITGARDLTASDYAEMLWEDKRRKKEIEEQKQKRK